MVKKLVLNQIKPALETALPNEQAGFRDGRICSDQVLALTTSIESGFQKQLKTGAAFIHLSSAYDAVWCKGLLLKLSKIIQYHKTLRLINTLTSNRKFPIYLGDKTSRTRTLNNGLPQGSVLAPAFFNIYTADMPCTKSRKFVYADDIALLTQTLMLEEASRMLTSDLDLLECYFQT